jgi:hypothetical protein
LYKQYDGKIQNAAWEFKIKYIFVFIFFGHPMQRWNGSNNKRAFSANNHESMLKRIASEYIE